MAPGAGSHSCSSFYEIMSNNTFHFRQKQDTRSSLERPNFSSPPNITFHFRQTPRFEFRQNKRGQSQIWHFNFKCFVIIKTSLRRSYGDRLYIISFSSSLALNFKSKNICDRPSFIIWTGFAIVTSSFGSRNAS